jgi:hypothetical protein
MEDGRCSEPIERRLDPWRAQLARMRGEQVPEQWRPSAQRDVGKTASRAGDVQVTIASSAQPGWREFMEACNEPEPPDLPPAA